MSIVEEKMNMNIKIDPQTLTKLCQIAVGLEKKYPDGKNPFKIITRLAEECGELAEQVNHFEQTGIKNEKHGAPDKNKMAKEVQDVIRCALQIARYYKLDDELTESIERSHAKLKDAGFIED